MKTVFIFGLLIGLNANAGVVWDGVRKLHASKKSFICEVTQQRVRKDFKSGAPSIGRIYFQKPFRFRWETFDPDAQIMVSDGRKVQHYVPPMDETDQGQLIEKPAAGFERQMMVDLLTGGSKAAKTFVITESAQGLVMLKPRLKKNLETITEIQIKVSKEDGTIQELKWVQRDGTESILTLTKYVWDSPMPAGIFTIQPAKGTVVVKEKN